MSVSLDLDVTIFESKLDSIICTKIQELIKQNEIASVTPEVIVTDAKVTKRKTIKSTSKVNLRI